MTKENLPGESIRKNGKTIARCMNRTDRLKGMRLNRIEGRCIRKLRQRK